MPLPLNAMHSVFRPALDSARRVVAAVMVGAFVVLHALAVSAQPLPVRWNAIGSGAGPGLGLGTASAVDTRRGELVMFGMWRPAWFFRTEIFQASDEAYTVFARMGSVPEVTAAVQLPGSPPRRSKACAAYDSLTDRVWMFGGGQFVPTPCTVNNCPEPKRAAFADLWWLDRSVDPPQWHEATPAGPGPAPRFDAAMVVDPSAHRLLVFGGRDSLGTIFGDLWELPLDGALAWHSITPSGPGPSARRSATLLHDAARGRILLVGGTDASGEQTDVWALSLGGTPVWSAVSIAGTPPAHLAHAALDRGRDRVLTFASTLEISTFALSGAPVWEVPQQIEPPTFFGADGGFGYDPVHDLYWVPYLFSSTGSFGQVFVDHRLFTQAGLPLTPAIDPVRDSVRFVRGMETQYWHLRPNRPTYSSVSYYQSTASGSGRAAGALPGPDSANAGVRFITPAMPPGTDYSSSLRWVENGFLQPGSTPVPTRTPLGPVDMDLTVTAAALDPFGVVHVGWQAGDDSLSQVAGYFIDRLDPGGWIPVKNDYADGAWRILHTEQLSDLTTDADYRVRWNGEAGTRTSLPLHVAMPLGPLDMNVQVEFTRFTADGAVEVHYLCLDDSLSRGGPIWIEWRFEGADWSRAVNAHPDTTQRIIWGEFVVNNSPSVDLRLSWRSPVGLSTAGLVHLVREGRGPVPPSGGGTSLAMGLPGPNPAGRSMSLDLKATAAGTATLRVLDLRGRVRRSWTFSTPMDARQTFDLQGLDPGMYVIAFEQGSLRRTRRVMVFR